MGKKKSNADIRNALKDEITGLKVAIDTGKKYRGKKDFLLSEIERLKVKKKSLDTDRDRVMLEQDINTSILNSRFNGTIRVGKTTVNVDFKDDAIPILRTIYADRDKILEEYYDADLKIDIHKKSIEHVDMLDKNIDRLAEATRELAVIEKELEFC